MRIKRGTTKKRKHSKVLKQTKGYRLTYSKLYRRAKEAVLHAGTYSYSDRKQRRGQLREEWINTISAGLAGTKYSYSKFIGELDKNNVEIDRKNLAFLAVNYPIHFKSLVESLG